MRKLIFVLILSFMQPAFGMEEAFSRSIVATLTDPEGTRSLEKPLFYTNLVLSVSQIIGLIILKKKDMLFGKRIIPEGETYAQIINQNVYPRNCVRLLGYASVAPSLLQLLLSHNPGSISLLQGSLGISYLLNLAHQDSLDEISKERVLDIKPAVFTKEKECTLCWEKLKNLVSICERNDHLYCKKCLIQWLNQVNEDGNLKYPCELCRKNISPERAKETIILTKLQTKKILWNMMGIKGLGIILLCYCMYNVLF